MGLLLKVDESREIRDGISGADGITLSLLQDPVKLLCLIQDIFIVELNQQLTDSLS
jgi:hypothetical protein